MYYYPKGTSAKLADAYAESTTTMPPPPPKDAPIKAKTIPLILYLQK